MTLARTSSGLRKMLPIELLEKLTAEPDSGIFKVRDTLHTAIHPKYLGNLALGIINYFNAQINQYHTQLNGILLGYGKIQLRESNANIINEEYHIHLDVLSDFWIFRPQPGCQLKGVVNKKSPAHISCLVHGLFNVPCYKPHDLDVGSEWWGYKAKLGTLVRFVVLKTDMTQRIPFILGDLPENGILEYEDKEACDDPMNIMLVEEIKEEDWNKVTPEDYDSGIDSTGKKRKQDPVEKKPDEENNSEDKEKGVFDESTVVPTDSSPSKKKKKKKKKKHKENDEEADGAIPNDEHSKRKKEVFEEEPKKEVFEEEPEKELKKKKKKKNKEKEAKPEETVEEEVVKIKKKKKKKDKDLELADLILTEARNISVSSSKKRKHDEDSDDPGKPSAKKSKNHDSDHKIVSPKKEAVSPKKKTVNEGQGSVSPKKKTVNEGEESVSPKKKTVNEGEESVSPKRKTVNEVQGSVSHKKKTVNEGEESVSSKKKTVNEGEPSEKESFPPGDSRDKNATSPERNLTFSADVPNDVPTKKTPSPQKSLKVSPKRITLEFERPLSPIRKTPSSQKNLASRKKTPITPEFISEDGTPSTGPSGLPSGWTVILVESITGGRPRKKWVSPSGKTFAVLKKAIEFAYSKSATVDNSILAYLTPKSSNTTTEPSSTTNDVSEADLKEALIQEALNRSAGSSKSKKK